MTGITAREHPEILGDVFAWNKLFRTSFWRAQGLEWPEGVRYEDQPTTTRAYLAGTFDVVPDVVYHWRIRQDGSSITQQRASIDRPDRPVADQADGPGRRAGVRRPRRRRRTSSTACMAGDLHRYFVEIPGASDEWWRLLVDGVHDLWGERSLVHSGLPPVHRLVGWLVERDRRADAESVVRWLADPGRTRAARRATTSSSRPPCSTLRRRPRRAGAARPRALTALVEAEAVTASASRLDLTGSRDGR